MIGLPVNYVWRGHGIALFLEFGKLTTDQGRNHPQGEFSLMLDCDWRIEKPRSIWFGSFCSYKRIENQINHLLGKTVKNIKFIGELPELVISLTPNLRVVSFNAYEGQPDWTIFLPDKSWLCCRLGKIIHEIAEPGA